MTASKARQLNPTQLIAEINRVADVILGFGEDVPQILSELRAIRDSSGRIIAIVAKRVGRSGQAEEDNLVLGFDGSDPVQSQLFADPTIRAKEDALLAAASPRDQNTVVAAGDTGGRSSGPSLSGPTVERAGIRDILLFFVQNPQFLQLILSLFKQTQNNPS